jgi:hypothetical protein
MTLPRVALAIADTQSYVLANNAIQACTMRFDFKQVYVFTDAPQHWPQYQTVSVPKMRGIEDYNRIILDELPKWVEEDFCLICQFDGFILDASAFSQDFYNFDYIGAVWPDYPHDRVGNGGFSWRSKKLLKAVAELSHLRQLGEAEDLFICRRLRAELEARYGCVFADEQTAQRFSYEIIPHTQPSFGFHGIFNLPMVYRNNLNFLIENLPIRVLAARMPYLQYGANQLESSQRQEFELLTGTAMQQYSQAVQR